MMAGKIAGMVLLLLLLLLLVLLAVVIIRAALIRPTRAAEAKVKLDESGRAGEYGQQLARMIQKETVSSR